MLVVVLRSYKVGALLALPPGGSGQVSLSSPCPQDSVSDLRAGAALQHGRQHAAQLSAGHEECLA